VTIDVHPKKENSSNKRRPVASNRSFFPSSFSSLPPPFSSLFFSLSSSYVLWVKELCFIFPIMEKLQNWSSYKYRKGEISSALNKSYTKEK